jgi:hypothetical protein
LPQQILGLSQATPVGIPLTGSRDERNGYGAQDEIDANNPLEEAKSGLWGLVIHEKGNHNHY